MSVSATIRLPVPLASADTVDRTIREAQRGDEIAFAALYDAHAPRVHAVCLGLSGDRAAAAELTQDVFVRVWEKLSAYRGESSFATWLHRVAVNTVLESKRSDRRRSVRVMIAADFAGMHDDAAGTLPDRPGVTHDTGLVIDLETAILRLPAGARAVFILHDVEGYQHAEIGERLSIAEGTSKAHLFRARRLLREMLAP